MLVCVEMALSQTINFYPDQFGTTPQTLSLTNPVYLDIMPFQGIRIGSKNNTGAFSEIRTIYAQGNINVQQHNNQHFIGADFISEQEGPVIRKNRMHFDYALQKKITDELFISFGSHLGLASYDYNGKKSTSQGSSIGPDGSIAFLMKYKNWRVGMHLNQFFDQLYKPKTTTFNYPSYHGYYIDRTWKLNDGSELRIFHLNHILKDQSNIISVGTNFEYKKALGLGVIYHYNYYITPSLYFKLEKATNYLKGIDIYFSYNTVIQNLSESNINSFEVGMSISFQ